MNATTQTPSSADVARGREAVQHELVSAREEHDKAAYEAATNPGDQAREELANARRRIGVLQSELEGLDAVGREAKRREQLASLATRIEAAEADRKTALAAVAEVMPTFLRVKDAISELGEACEALQAVEQRANRAEGKNAQMPHGREFYPGSFNCTPLRDALLWLAFRNFEEPVLQRSELVADSAGNPVPYRTVEVLEKWNQRACDQIHRGINRRIADLKAESERLASKAASVTRTAR